MDLCTDVVCLPLSHTPGCTLPVPVWLRWVVFTIQIRHSSPDNAERAAVSALMGSEGERAGWAGGVGREASGSLFSESWESGVCVALRLVMREEGRTY